MARKARGMLLVGALTGALGGCDPVESGAEEGLPDSGTQSDVIIEAVDPTERDRGFTAAYLSMDVDQYDHVHMAYLCRGCADGGPAVMYATNETGSWTTTMMGIADDNRQCAAITLQASNEPRIAYAAEYQVPVYAERVDGNWIQTPLSYRGAFGMAIGVSEAPAEVHIMHHLLVTGGELGHAIMDHYGSWTTLSHGTPDANEGSFPSMHVAGNGAVDVVYHRIWPEPEGLQHGHYFDGRWQAQELEPPHSPRWPTAIGVDGANWLHMVYDAYPLRYAIANPARDRWQSETLAPGGRSGDIAVTTTATVHTCYIDGETGQDHLVYAWGSATAWNTFELPVAFGPETLTGSPECRIRLGRGNRFDRVHIGFINGGSVFHAELPLEHRSDP